MVLGLAAALAACAGRGAGGPIGTSAGTRADGVSADGGAKPGDAPLKNPIPADFRTSLVKVNHARFVSNGHAASRYEMDVYASAAGKDALLAERGEVPVGARLVAEHFERAGETHGGPVMMMEKREKGFDAEHGDWRYVVIGAAGEVVKDGVVESCAGCHGDAPHDHLFRVAE